MRYFKIDIRRLIWLTNLISLLSINTSTSAIQQRDNTHYSYLPIIQTPLPPPSTESRYLVLAVNSVFDRYGCKQGQAMQSGQKGLVVLLFGKPTYNPADKVYGTTLFDRDQTFVSTENISRSAELWADGFWRCTLPDGPKIQLAIGTSNNGITSELASAHAQAWAHMVNDVSNYLAYKHYDKQISIAAANNIELKWSKPDTAKLWVDSYTAAAQRRLYILGDCSGCPYSSYPYRIPDNGWTQEDIWYISWGAVRSYPLPEIYNIQGSSASQWQFIAQWGVKNRGQLMLFSGALTQWQACIDQPDICDGTDNRPEKAWKQLWDYLNQDAATAQNPEYITDLRWNY